MLLKILTPKSKSDLKMMLENHYNVLVFGAQTSTVVPFHRPEILASFGLSNLLDLSCMPKLMKLISRDSVYVEGAVSWSELREFLHDYDLEVGCWPTDETALVLSGLATSATGERCFSYGSLREHCEQITYLDNNLQEVLLKNSDLNENELTVYQKNFDLKYSTFKNGPYPRLKKETDLMIGTEGQLGIILSTTLRVFKKEKTNFILLPVKSNQLKEIVSLSRGFKDKIKSLEFFDENSLSYAKEHNLVPGDYVAFEVLEDELEFISEKLSHYDLGSALFLSHEKFSKIRVSIPRGVNEYLSHNKILKLGTDAQVRLEDFDKLLSIYDSWSKSGIKYVLFGHLGDCHLHFNFLPKESQIEDCQQMLNQFYLDLAKMEASPFAEHGIGFLKQKYMTPFYNDDIKNVFKYLEEKHNSNQRFYKKGFLGND